MVDSYKAWDILQDFDRFNDPTVRVERDAVSPPAVLCNVETFRRNGKFRCQGWLNRQPRPRKKDKRHVKEEHFGAFGAIKELVVLVVVREFSKNKY